MTLLVMVRIDMVGFALRYALCRASFCSNDLTISTAIRSTRSSSLPNFGKSPSVMKSQTRPASFSTGLTFAYRIAEKLSASTESPAMPPAIVRTISSSCSAISIRS